MVDNSSSPSLELDSGPEPSQSLSRLLLGTSLVGLAVLIMIFGIPTLMFIGLLSYERFSNDQFFANTPVLADQLGRSDEEAESSFSETILAAFPIGSSGTSLRQKLGQQGFQRSTGSEGFTNALKTERSAFPCRTSWTVLWRENATNAITAVKGLVTRYCL